MAGVKLVSCFKSVCIVIAFPGHSLPFFQSQSHVYILKRSFLYEAVKEGTLYVF